MSQSRYAAVTLSTTRKSYATYSKVARGRCSDAVILNAAAAIATHELTRGNLKDVLADCLERSRRAIDSGAAAATLRAWLERSGALVTT